jgi:hypothetical protein
MRKYFGPNEIVYNLNNDVISDTQVQRGITDDSE